jgi:FkbM family methyltransferase
MYTLSGSLGEIVSHLQTSLGQYPRRVPGTLLIDGLPVEYVDLHGFYHQTMQIFGSRLYDYVTESDNPVILDCGAHIGLATLFFKQRFPSSSIIAFEADPKIAEVCERNFRQLALSGVVLKNQAIWTNEGVVTFDMSNDDAGAIRGMGESPGVKVPSTSLRAILTDLSEVDLVKMDIEGAEFEVIPHCGDLLTKSRAYIIEAHLFNSSNSLAKLLGVLESVGFRYVLSDLHQAEWLVNSVKPPFHECRTDKYYLTIFAWRQ